MPALAAVAAFAATTGGGTAIAAGVTGASMLAAAHKNASATRDAANAQLQANEDALTLEKQKDAEDRAQFEATQRANYDQYLNRYNAAKGLGAEYGLNLPDAKPYVTTTGGSQPTNGATP